MSVNVLRLTLYINGALGPDLEGIRALTWIPMLFKYLGVPLATTKLKVMHYSPLMDKIMAYINERTSKNL